MRSDKLLETLSRKLEKEANNTPEVVMKNKFKQYKRELKNGLKEFIFEDMSDGITGLMGPNKKGWVAGYTKYKYKMEDNTVEYLELVIDYSEPYAVFTDYSISVTCVSFVEDKGETYQSKVAYTFTSYDVTTNEITESTNTLDKFISTVNDKLSDIEKRAISKEEV